MIRIQPDSSAEKDEDRSPVSYGSSLSHMEDKREKELETPSTDRRARVRCIFSIMDKNIAQISMA